MAVDIKLNEMIKSKDDVLRGVWLKDCELSVRTLRALDNLGAKTLLDAERLLLDGTLKKQKGIGRRACNEVREIIPAVLALPADRLPKPEPLIEDTPGTSQVEMLEWQLEQKVAQYERLVETNNALQADVTRLSRLLNARDEQIVKLRKRLTCVLNAMTIAQLKELNVSFQIDWDEVDAL